MQIKWLGARIPPLGFGVWPTTAILPETCGPGISAGDYFGSSPWRKRSARFSSPGGIDLGTQGSWQRSHSIEEGMSHV